MSLDLRPMRPEEAEEVAGMVRGLARHIGTDVVPKLTGETLRASADLIDVTVAEEGGRLIGACLGLMTFSTWRGAPGLYVVDLFVDGQARGRNVGLALLRASARRFARRGAKFIKLEVDETNTGAQRFYARLGFAKKSEDRLHILEQDGLDQLIAEGGEK
jgi:ribosomal protein S18 acetylase RimI-like enzyme